MDSIGGDAGPWNAALGRRAGTRTDLARAGRMRAQAAVHGIDGIELLRLRFESEPIDNGNPPDERQGRARVSHR